MVDCIMAVMRADEELVLGTLRMISVATIITYADRLVPMIDQARVNIERAGRQLVLARLADALQARADQIERAEAIYWESSA